MLTKSNENNELKMLKLKINFDDMIIESMSYGDVSLKKFETGINIIYYDYNNSLIIIDTHYEPLSPLKGKILGRNSPIKYPTRLTYFGRNNVFNFASKNMPTKQPVTQRYRVLRFNQIINKWNKLY